MGVMTTKPRFGQRAKTRYAYMTAMHMTRQLQYDVGVAFGLAYRVGCMSQQNNRHACGSVTYRPVDIHPTMPDIINAGEPDATMIVLYGYTLVLEHGHSGE